VCNAKTCPFSSTSLWAKFTGKLTNLSLPTADKKKADQAKADAQAKMDAKIKK
jgi:hypothetical protein